MSRRPYSQASYPLTILYICLIGALLGFVTWYSGQP